MAGWCDPLPEVSIHCEFNELAVHAELEKIVG